MTKNTNAVRGNIENNGHGCAMIVLEDARGNKTRYTMEAAAACRFAGQLLNMAEGFTRDFAKSYVKTLSADERAACLDRGVKVIAITPRQARRAAAWSSGQVYRRRAE
jgi:hypothetical protein